MSFSYDIEFAAHDEICPVCGELDATCVGEYPFSGGILFDDEPPRDNPAATFIVPRRIWVEEQVGTRSVKRLKYPVGARITPEEARSLGLLPPLR